MIPIHDDNPTRTFPWLTVALIAANVAVFTYEVTRTPAELARIIDTWAFVPAHLSNPATLLPAALTILTSAFIHAGWIHVGGNMLYLWIFGNNIEDRLGRVRFALFYVVCASAAAVAQTIATPHSDVPMVGASGAVAGVLGAYLLLFPRAQVIALIPIFFYIELASLPAVFVIGFWFVLQIAQGLTALGGTMESGVAWWAHVGGFIAGALLVVPLLAHVKLRKPRRTRTRRRSPER